MDIVIVGIDLGKNSCSVAGLDPSGRVVLRRRMRRNVLENFVQGLQRCIVAMEACCGAHHLGRMFEAQGHAVRLMSPEYVQPYVKAQKNDDRDAEAIAEAATRPTMRFVAMKEEAQLDMQTLHRARSRLVNSRTADQPTAGDPARARRHGGQGPAGARRRAEAVARRCGNRVEPKGADAGRRQTAPVPAP